MEHKSLIQSMRDLDPAIRYETADLIQERMDRYRTLLQPKMLVCELMERVTVGPNFFLERPGYKGYQHDHAVVVGCTAPNTYHPDTETTLRIAVYVQYGATIEQLMNRIFEAMMRIEEHETAEWLKLDGVPYFNPHQPHHWSEDQSYIGPADHHRKARYL